MRAAVVYDFLQVRGGAEHLSRFMASQLPADLHVHSVSRQGIVTSEPRVLALSPRPTSASGVRRALAAWAGFEFMPKQQGYAQVIFSGHYAPLAWHAFPEAHRILYLHATPLPFALDPNDESRFEMPLVMRFAAAPAMQLLLARYKMAAGKMHSVLANSSFVAEAFQQLTGRGAEVVQPPVEEAFFHDGECDVSGGYWLCWARHEPVKRIDRVVEAFLQMPDQKLVIAGAGGCTESLVAQAGGAKNIQFVGELDRDELIKWMRPAIGALHLSRAEPYGLAIAEAVAAGKFVIAPDEGGVRDIIEESVDGALLAPNPSPLQIVSSIREWGPRIEQGLWKPSISSRINHSADFLSAIGREFAAIAQVSGAKKS